MSEFYHDLIDTSKGFFSILFSSEGIYEIFFPGSDPDPQYPHRHLPWPQLAGDLNRYLQGENVNWDQYPLDCRGYRSFTAALLGIVSHIPHGRVYTYRQAAELAGSPLAWRAAGQALRANRHPIIVPCHRIVGSNGKLGGFSGPPGWKKMLLEIEKCVVYSE